MCPPLSRSLSYLTLCFSLATPLYILSCSLSHSYLLISPLSDHSLTFIHSLPPVSQSYSLVLSLTLLPSSPLSSHVLSHSLTLTHSLLFFCVASIV